MTAMLMTSGFKKAPLDADFIDFFQVADGVPAVVAGGDDKLGAGGKNLIPFDLHAGVALLAGRDRCRSGRRRRRSRNCTLYWGAFPWKYPGSTI